MKRIYTGLPITLKKGQLTLNLRPYLVFDLTDDGKVSQFLAGPVYTPDKSTLRKIYLNSEPYNPPHLDKSKHIVPMYGDFSERRTFSKRAFYDKFWKTNKKKIETICLEWVKKIGDLPMIKTKLNLKVEGIIGASCYVRGQELTVGFSVGFNPAFIARLTFEQGTKPTRLDEQYIIKLHSDLCYELGLKENKLRKIASLFRSTTNSVNNVTWSSAV